MRPASTPCALRAALHGHLSFFKDLSEGDDWSFVIKTQALVESRLNQSIVVKLHDERIRQIIERLPLAGEGATKLHFAEELGLLDSPQRRFVRRMATLRNQLAHRVDRVNFVFADYVTSLDRNARKDWQESIVWFGEDPASKAHWRSAALSSPQSAVMMGALTLVNLLAVSDSEAWMTRSVDEASERATTELLQLASAAGQWLSPIKGVLPAQE